MNEVSIVAGKSAATLWAFIKLGRPVFLLGGFVLYGLGALWARRAHGTFDLATFLLGQGAITAAQLMTHYANDYFDVEVDRANLTPTRWSGGSRVLVEGVLSPRVAWRAAVVLAGVASLLGLLAISRAPSPALAGTLLAAIILLAWFYSAPPLRFVARGAGELTTAAVVTVLTPVFGFHLQSAAPEPALLLTLPALALLQLTMLFAINFPDAEGDRATGKRTWVVMLGAARAVRVCRGLLLVWLLFLPLLALLLAKSDRPWQLALGPAICVPVVAWQLVALGGVTAASRGTFAALAFRGVAALFVASAATVVAVALSPWPLAHP